MHVVYCLGTGTADDIIWSTIASKLAVVTNILDGHTSITTASAASTDLHPDSWGPLTVRFTTATTIPEHTHGPSDTSDVLSPRTFPPLPLGTPKCAAVQCVDTEVSNHTCTEQQRSYLSDGSREPAEMFLTPPRSQGIYSQRTPEETAAAAAVELADVDESFWDDDDEACSLPIRHMVLATAQESQCVATGEPLVPFSDGQTLAHGTICVSRPANISNAAASGCMLVADAHADECAYLEQQHTPL